MTSSCGSINNVARILLTEPTASGKTASSSEGKIVLRLQKKRRVRTTGRQSLGGLRSPSKSGVHASPGSSGVKRPKRKSMGSAMEIGNDSHEKAEQAEVGTSSRRKPVSSELGDSSAYTSDSEPTSESKARSSIVEANVLGLITSPTVPRRSARRSSLSAAPLSIVVPSFAASSSTTRTTSPTKSNVSGVKMAQGAMKERGVSSGGIAKSSRPPTPIKAPPACAKSSSSANSLRKERSDSATARKKACHN